MNGVRFSIETIANDHIQFMGDGGGAAMTFYGSGAVTGVWDLSVFAIDRITVADQWTVDGVAETVTFVDATDMLGVPFYVEQFMTPARGHAPYGSLFATELAEPLFERPDIDQMEFISGALAEGNAGDNFAFVLSGTVVNALGGDDMVYLFGQTNSFVRAGQGDDLVRSGAGHDVLSGNAGDDFIFAGGGDDMIRGGGGGDHLWGQAGDDTLLGGDGDDWITVDQGHDLVHGDAGNDHISIALDAMSDDAVTVHAGTGDDRVYGEHVGAALLRGQTGDDWMRVSDGDATVHGQRGDDTLIARDGDQLVTGGQGADWLFSGGGDDTLRGGSDGDLFVLEIDSRISVGGQVLNTGDRRQVTIDDFDSTEDRLMLQHRDGTDYSATDAYALFLTDAMQIGADVVFDNGICQIRLEDMALSDIDESVFHFETGYIW